MQVFGLWEETRASGWNRENKQTHHRTTTGHQEVQIQNWLSIHHHAAPLLPACSRLMAVAQQKELAYFAK